MAIKTHPGTMAEIYAKESDHPPGATISEHEVQVHEVLLDMEEYSDCPKTCKKLISAAYFVAFGWRPFVVSLDLLTSEWPYYFPRPLMAFSMILAICMGLAIGALCLWHYYLIFTAQTTVEFYNNYYDKKQCKRQGEVFINMYDFGFRENARRFFNVCEQFPWYTILYPIPIPPRGNGRVFEKCEEFYLLPKSRQREQIEMQREVQELEDDKDI
ncbi:hypothetical protein BDC45DRAFT_580031 [Circinella umbellata]|nr:hypothetical protein BDC45DRAFT_580031 [Circinella umbellata]